jgi:large exoprotein involved in heme utilization and adhesion
LETRKQGTLIGTGDSGNLIITTGRLQVRDGAQISVSGLSLQPDAGDAGELDVIARVIELDNQGAIAATTTSGHGGDIVLQVQDLLLLRRNSRISTTAGIEGTGGDGGNIAINAELIAAVPGENSDITANAFLGRGGRIMIKTQGLFGLEIPTREDLQALLNTDDLSQFAPSQLPSNDITAISQTNPQLSGDIALQLLEIDPVQGLVELSEEFVDVAGLVEQNLCVAAQGSEFTITGRGGLPTPPHEPLTAEATWEDWRINSEREPTGVIQSYRSDRVSKVPANRQQGERTSVHNQPKPIVEAQGWYRDAQGNVILTANPTTVTPHQGWLSSYSCQSGTLTFSN